MRLKKFNENTNRLYLNNGDDGVCPVCGNCKDLIQTNSTPTKDGMEYYYECPKCDFKWFETYVMVEGGIYDYNDGGEITEGEVVNPKNYNEIKLQADKYN